MLEWGEGTGDGEGVKGGEGGQRGVDWVGDHTRGQVAKLEKVEDLKLEQKFKPVHKWKKILNKIKI